MNLIKIGFWVSLLALILNIIALIMDFNMHRLAITFMMIGTTGYFLERMKEDEDGLKW